MNAKSEQIYMKVQGLEVASWSPGNVSEGDPCTQVHMIWEVPDLGVIEVMRLKSREAVDSLIAALVAQRDYVWPEEG